MNSSRSTVDRGGAIAQHAPSPKRFDANTTKADVPPVALRVWKNRVPIIVGKLTFLGKDLVLGIAIKNQRGTAILISVPLVVLQYAQGRGVSSLYWRRDREPREMRRIEIDQLQSCGWEENGEIYILLERMERVPWEPWPYAEQIIDLGEVG